MRRLGQCLSPSLVAPRQTTTRLVRRVLVGGPTCLLDLVFLITMLPKVCCLAALNSRLSAPLNHILRSPPLVAQSNWIQCHDEVSGNTYYYDQQTGESQWRPPANQQGAQQLIWRVLPASAGIWKYSEYAVRNGEEQVLGRYDMAEPSVYVSRKQCLVEVDDSGIATLLSIGKPLTLCRARGEASWRGLRKARPLGDDIGFDGAHILADGDQISLDMRNPDTSIFTVVCDDASDAMRSGYDDARYSDDGEWMWDGADWVPTRNVDWSLM